MTPILSELKQEYHALKKNITSMSLKETRHEKFCYSAHVISHLSLMYHCIQFGKTIVEKPNVTFRFFHFSCVWVEDPQLPSSFIRLANYINEIVPVILLCLKAMKRCQKREAEIIINTLVQLKILDFNNLKTEIN